ncbi:hypothetical protein [Deinococcus sp.]|uniref:hypothetical protein n=1 Tax=Deinococcus sp. TaxID=47478 RepID=UPI003C7CDACF
MNRRWGCGCGGCLGSVLIGLLVIAGLGYFLVYRPVQSFLAGFGTPAATQTAAQQAQTQAALSTADVRRFVRVRRSVRTAMGSSFSGVQKVFTDIQNGQSPNAMAVLGVLREAAGSVGAARSAQQAALAREGMNQARYTYVRGEVNKALGVPDIDFQKVARSVSEGKLPDLNTTVRPPDTATQKLVTPFKAELTVTAPLGLLGL